MFNWFKRYLKKRLENPCAVRIRLKDTLAFTGEVVSFDISTDVDGSDAKVVIKFKALDLIHKLVASQGEVSRIYNLRL